MKLWLIDSRNRKHAKKREIHVWHNANPVCVANAWTTVLKQEIGHKERDQYAFLYTNIDTIDSEDDQAEIIDVFRDYWAEYGWDLSFVEDDVHYQGKEAVQMIPRN